MARYKTTVASPATAEEVFDYLADFANTAEWDPSVRSGELLSGTPGTTGAVYRLQFGFPGLSMPLDYRIVEAEAPSEGREGRVEVLAKTADFTSYDVITVAPSDGGCEVTYDADLALQGIRRPFDPFLQAAFAVIGSLARGGLENALQQDQLT